MILTIAAKTIIGLILALVGSARFEETWKMEHGISSINKPKSKYYNKDTFIYLFPTAFLWIVLIVIIFYFIEFGIASGTGILINLFVNVIAFSGVYSVILLLLMPYLRQKISSRACAVLWFCPILIFFGSYPEFIFNNSRIFTVYLSKNAIKIIILIWFLGFLISYGRSLILHHSFRKKVLSESYAVADEKTIAIFENVCKGLEFSRPTALFISPYIDSPFSMGRIKRTRCVVLPPQKYSEEELKMIFLHEVHHLQRWDVDTKIFLTFLKCVCWFNPFSWIAVKEASRDIELSCDEIVTEKMTSEERKSYAQLLLTTASGQRGFTTCLSTSAEALRYRLKNVVQLRSRSLGKTAIIIAIFISSIFFNLIAITDERGTLKSFVTLDGQEMSYRIEYNIYSKSDIEQTADNRTSDGSKFKAEASEDEMTERLLSDTIVEHYLCRQGFYTGEEPEYYIYINGSQGGNGYRLVTIYENYVTITDIMQTGAEEHPEVFRIIHR